MNVLRATAALLVLGSAGLLLQTGPAVSQGPAPQAENRRPDAPGTTIVGQGGDVVSSENGIRATITLYNGEAVLEQQAAGLMREYAQTEDEGQRAKVKTKLADLLNKQFDMQQKRRDQEVAAIEAQLKKLRELMRKRGENRQKIIDNRLDQLVREAEGLGWTPAADAKPVYPPLRSGAQ